MPGLFEVDDVDTFGVFMVNISGHFVVEVQGTEVSLFNIKYGAIRRAYVASEQSEEVFLLSSDWGVSHDLKITNQWFIKESLMIL